MTACRLPLARWVHVCAPCPGCGHAWGSHRLLESLAVLECSLCELHAGVEAHLRQEANDG